MNYTINLPEDLRTISKPRFKIFDEQLIIFNKPFWSDWIFEIFTFFGIIFFTNNKQVSYSSDYLILFIALWLYGLSYFSLNKIVIDFRLQTIHVKNYNPLVNLFRSLFKMPSQITFNEVEKIYSDWKLGGRFSWNRYFTLLQTEAPYRFKIANFESENQSMIFTTYLNNKIKAE